MNRKSVLIMVLIAFLLFQKANYGTIDIPQNYTEGGDNFHNFFDALKDQMEQYGFTPAEFLDAARAVINGFKNGGSFTIFTQYTEEGFRQAYDYVFANPTNFGFNQEDFTGVDAGNIQQFFSFIKTCFASFSTMTPIQQLNAFIQLSGFYICLKQLFAGVTAICTGAYNLGKMTITTFKGLYNGLTANAATTGTNPDPIPISIVIPPAQNTGFAAAPQVASPTTIGEVKKSMDKMLFKLLLESKEIDENIATVDDIFLVLQGSMSDDDLQNLLVKYSEIDKPFLNRMSRNKSLPTGKVTPFFRLPERSESLDPENLYSTSLKQMISNKKPPSFKTSEVHKAFKEKLNPPNKSGGRRKRTKRRKQSKRRKTKRRKSTYKRRR